MDFTGKKIAVLIPCYNEEASVAKVVGDFRSILPQAEIYVYNNNSTDNTEEAARQAGAIVRNEYRQGKGNVVRSMFRDIDADCYIMVDGDDTYPAEDCLPMVEQILEGKADMVIGDRLSTSYFTENKRPFHNFGNKLVRGLINHLFSSKVVDIMTGYRAFNREFIECFPVLSKGFEIETEMTIHALNRDFLIKEIPVSYRDRCEGSESKLNTVSDGIKVLKTVVRLYKDYRPLSFFGLFALMFLLLAVIFAIPVLIDYFQTGIVPRFPTLIVSCGLGMCSLQLFTIGLVLDSIVKHNKEGFELEIGKVYRRNRRNRTGCGDSAAEK